MMSSSCIPRTRELAIVVDQPDHVKKMRRLSKDFQQMLDKAFTTTPKQKQLIYKEGEKHFAGEMFRFYAAIVDWEAQYKVDKKRSKLLASKLVSTFVEPGAMYENGCLSSYTREQLLQRKVNDTHFFENAKYEVANDIQTNPVLRSIVERFALGNILSSQKSSTAIPNPASD